ncbi:hypothetical protein QTG54_009030 [Skeletonema marinoi]|uniref:GPI inositol-deacylase n=1 Tax=Skeletonema marinoi TaxID=267567 RepID=A0AAD8Y6M8_9STRA|nr:hypothetical protein QTG54_009030 [Skeletonema marinoi]
MHPCPTAAMLLVWQLVLPTLSSAYDANRVVCDADQNIFCPPSTSCCPTFKSRKEPDVIVGYSCLMGWSSRFPRGPCCPHYEDEAVLENFDGSSWRGGTGCGNGYECASSSIDRPICVINSAAHPMDYQGNPFKNKYETMPRYRACKSFTKDGISLHGLPMPLSAALSYKNSSSLTSTDGLEAHYMGQLAYYSNIGQITADDRVNSDIKTAIIGIHGSGRDAGTYLCALTAIAVDASKERSFLRGQKGHLNRKDVLVVAPWFTAPADDIPPTSSSLPYLQWDAQYPIFHTWRYGAESILDANDKHNMTISSFGAMDVLLESLCDRNHFPNLQRIVVIGHSAGGQFVHRWALSSNSWCFGNGQFAHRWAPKAALPNVRVVVANPRSFTYLDARRYFVVSDQIVGVKEDERSLSEDKGTLTPFNTFELRSPSAAEENECNSFNKYEWGLDPDERVPAPYVINNVQKLIDHGDNTELFCRYASRDVIYLTGQRDIETLSAENRYQGLHGDRFQGPSRRERSERFFASLQVRGRELEFCGRIGGEATQVHERHIVKQVAHDHALMFSSPEGIQAMFG